ncbi:MAG: DUF1800 domain-containing protein [Mycobacterium sp.]|uniref:DUF1800 domain-containing protein n=1 Tax=Mycobacterium sp. TaxID=1785 RepID=UPI002620CA5E|nr:DUF1800 domain-containing protein [Mycobacterium sp.]MDI3314033.1 DUF1800 domain-containing protein [Mycobacterium sp.]
MAHLLRRAGFGASADELDSYVAAGYEATVEALLNPPEETPSYGCYEGQDLVDRYFTASVGPRSPEYAWPQWMWRLLTTTSPLREKMALFWHGLFATGVKYPLPCSAQLAQIEMFRRRGMGRFEELLRCLSRDPAMLFWLDNQANHKDAPNENYARELLELFTMGVGNYTEADVKAAARAFTGWGVGPMMPQFFLGTFPAWFCYDDTDHDATEKTFLGHTGAFNGDDVIAIIVRQPATARFICDRLYRFFVADEPDDSGRAEIARLSKIFMDNSGDLRGLLRTIFTSGHFRSEQVRYRKVKSPVELMVGTARLTARWQLPVNDVAELARDAHFMGQSLLNPPSVEGWHEGEEWIDSAGLIERINCASAEIAQPSTPGVARILARVVARVGGRADLTPLVWVDACLEAMGSLRLSAKTRQVLAERFTDTPLLDDHGDTQAAQDYTLQLLRAIVSTPDYQYC